MSAALLAQQERLSGKITRFITNTERTGADKQNEDFFNARIQLLETYWKQFMEHHEKLFNGATAEFLTSTYFTLDTYSDIERHYVENLGYLKGRVREITNPPNNDNNGHSKSTLDSSNATENLISNLPKISIPSFSGDYLEWPSFRDLYKSLIHKNDSIANVQKLHYLKTSLVGEAQNLIKHLPTTNSNYQSAWKILNDRYENKRVLVNSYISSIMNLPAMKTESAIEIRRVLDSATQAIGALTNLDRPVKHWGDWIIYVIAQKLVSNTRKDWENSLSPTAHVPEFEAIKTFLEGRLRTLEAMGNGQSFIKTKYINNRMANSAHSHYSLTAKRCIGCGGKHLLMFCNSFRTKPTEQRRVFVRERGLCFNCLRSGHSVSKCPSAERCKVCSQLHHTMLHLTQRNTLAENRHPSSTTSNQPTDITQVSTVTHSHTTTTTRTPKQVHPTSGSVLLATAKILLRSIDGRTQLARALLDQGSESTFISTKVVKALGLSQRKVCVPILGVGSCEAGLAQAQVSFDILPRNNDSKVFPATALVIPSLTSILPNFRINTGNWPHLQGIDLADPDFSSPDVVDVIIGADLYARLLLTGLRRGPVGTPIAQKTHLGWILSGRISGQASKGHQPISTFHITLGEDLNASLRRFWEIEEANKEPVLTPDEAACEEFFKSTTQRDSTGRYIVRLPRRANQGILGNTRAAAISSLHRMEKQFFESPELHLQYSKFLNEYLSLGHMQQIPTHQIDLKPSEHYYLPHHAVLKPSSTSTNLRVVFNASHKSTTGVSLNDCVHTGPKLQHDLATIILKWRFFPYVYCADIEKMYRQILVHLEDSEFQRIVWRDNSSSSIQDYRLLTVTYGTACAPFLACRVLQQLAYDHQHENPIGAKLLLNHFYVDDALFGDYNIPSARIAKNQLNTLLNCGGFRLRKWASNNNDLLDDISDEDKETSSPLRVLPDCQIKTLGILWNSDTDTFQYEIQPFSHVSKYTKRDVLSDISRIFDPLGWLAPVLVLSKIFLQKLWLAKLDWDDDLPHDLSKEWHNYRVDLKKLEEIQIERWLGTTNENAVLELHGFCDASLAAYSAVVYLRILYDFHNAQVSLVTCKTKVAPLKTVSVPRLELCGAVLLARLLNSVRKTLKLDSIPIHAWTDSTVVLAWLKAHPSRWKIFIANRTSEIQTLLPDVKWHFISTHQNPADAASRRLRPSELQTLSLWWKGPTWLTQHSSSWPTEITNKISCENDLEERVQTSSHVSQATKVWSLLTRYSSLKRLLRVTAWCQRFINNCKTKTRSENMMLSPSDIDASLTFWIKYVQNQAFPEEIRRIANDQSLNRNSKLINLNPGLDENNVLRVGGRLQHSLLSESECHPIIIPAETHLTTLIIHDSHMKTLHGGIQLTLQHTRTQFWIINARNKVRSYIHNCLVCLRYRLSTRNQLMGALPPARVRPSKPFEHTGVDYAGPINITTIRYRGSKSFKAFIALFVCFSTRAVHLELISQLTSEAFIAAFRRFIARRGRCLHLYSDNATNFIGANVVLQRQLREANTQHHNTLGEALSQEGVEWHFIPPASPHCGGLWEAGIKSVKHHLRRVVGSSILSMEEMSTLLAEIEACLNSRPIHPLTDDPEDVAVLTPGHFLMGCAPLTVPAPTITDTSISALTRWKLVQAMVHHFWIRWYKKYIHHLQQRRKWQTEKPSIKTNDLVIVKEDNLPPCKWMIARVTGVFPGPDGLVRVVQLKHGTTYLKRHIAKLCVLPTSTQPETCPSRRAEVITTS